MAGNAWKIMSSGLGALCPSGVSIKHHRTTKFTSELLRGRYSLVICRVTA
jgi:hypothetical protein